MKLKVKQRYKKKNVYLQRKRQQSIDELSIIMEYNIIIENQKIINLLDHLSNQPSKFRRRNWIEINDESRQV